MISRRINLQDPDLQGEDDARARYRCACTEGPVFDAARVRWPGEEASRARRATLGAKA